MTRLRVLRLDGLELVLRIQHAHLPAAQRVENSGSSVEVLQVGLKVEYRPRKDSEGFSSVFNYAGFFDAVHQHQQSSWQRSFEELADDLLDLVLQSANQQSITVEKAVVRIERPELAGIHITVAAEWIAASSE